MKPEPLNTESLDDTFSEICNIMYLKERKSLIEIQRAVNKHIDFRIKEYLKNGNN